MTNADRVQSIIDRSKSSFVSVRFLKKDGTERTMTINPAQIGEIKGTGRQCSDPDIFRFVDSKLGQWRSFDAKRVVSIKSNGHVTVF